MNRVLIYSNVNAYSIAKRANGRNGILITGKDILKPLGDWETNPYGGTQVFLQFVFVVYKLQTRFYYSITTQ